ncbi:helix-turn-helix domain-containing protein [Brachyspira pilosicoli]|uniref:Helix-turn-helix domain-containing protein n=1 Tax=Brachyspira pilosicoli TaxID=52584 RepID=A0AAJ6G9V3_BRAPL|nr:MerR family transcriptional regulator [Brachyspira pilosicoli]WIH90260.1 helix-turn-helix domain-containing protein [Brachyspira pilosicoli]WIH92551.1 helix-turn-helix domain-containing protein [Brachyspira pilosicoli]WIH94843.1 helix-turn-helix domain-containing protein [Brachyspira pilosicoli]
MARRDENNNIDKNARRDINAFDVYYFIKNKKYALPKYSFILKSKKILMSIGEFLKLLEDNNIKNMSINLLREWDNKELLPAYRVERGMIRTESRYYIMEHLDIVKEIVKLKSYGLEIREIEKVVFENKSFEILFLSKLIKNKELLMKMKYIVKNIKHIEDELVSSICNEVKNIFNINDDDFKETFNDKYLNTILNDYKSSNLNSDELSVLLLSLILLSLYNSYDNNSFDRKKFSKQFYSIISGNKINTSP